MLSRRITSLFTCYCQWLAVRIYDAICRRHCCSQSVQYCAGTKFAIEPLLVARMNLRVISPGTHEYLNAHKMHAGSTLCMSLCNCLIRFGNPLFN
jgi:hypothetical protein